MHLYEDGRRTLKLYILLGGVVCQSEKDVRCVSFLCYYFPNRFNFSLYLSHNNKLIQPFFAIFSGESGYNEVQMVNIGERFPESEVGCGPYIIYWYLIYNSKKMNKSYFNEQK